MEEKDYHLNPRVRFLGKELKHMANDLLTRKRELDCLNYKIEQHNANYFWAKQEFVFYMKEVNHGDTCDNTERIEPFSFSSGYEDIVNEMDDLCGELLDTMDTLYDSLSARILDIERLGPVLKYVANEQKKTILTCNHLNDLMFSRCNEKKYLEDPTSKITNHQIISLIQHVTAFGHWIMPGAPLTLVKVVSLLREQKEVPIKDISPTAFYHVRNYINTKLTSNPVKIQKIAYPYVNTGNVSYTVDDMKYIYDMVRRDRDVPAHQPFGVQPFPAVLNLFDNSEETINNE